VPAKDSRSALQFVEIPRSSKNLWKQPKTCYFPSNSRKPNLNRCRRIANQRLMLQNTFLVTVSNSPISRTLSLRRGFCLRRNGCAAIAVALLFYASTAFAQTSSEVSPQPIVAPKQAPRSEPVSSPQRKPNPKEQPQSSSAPTSVDANSLRNTVEVKQSKRILWIFPNYRAVSANTQLPPLTLKAKFWLATRAGQLRLFVFHYRGDSRGCKPSEKVLSGVWTGRQRL